MKAYTPDEYNAIVDQRGRTPTDAPIGRHTTQKRAADAAASAAVTETPTPLDEHRKEPA